MDMCQKVRASLNKLGHVQKKPLKYQFQNLYFLSESSELPRQVSFTNNEELNNSSSSTNPDGATPRKSDASRTRKKKAETEINHQSDVKSDGCETATTKIDF